MDKLYENSETGCCPRFDPGPWDVKKASDMVFNKQFILKSYLFFIPRPGIKSRTAARLRFFIKLTHNYHLTFCSPSIITGFLQKFSPLCRITHCLGEEHTLFRPQFKLLGCVLLIAIVEMGGQAL